MKVELEYIVNLQEDQGIVMDHHHSLEEKLLSQDSEHFLFHSNCLNSKIEDKHIKYSPIHCEEQHQFHQYKIVEFHE